MQPTFLPQQRTYDRERGKKIKAAGVKTQTDRENIKNKDPFDIREEEKKTEQQWNRHGIPDPGAHRRLQVADISGPSKPLGAKCLAN